MYGVREIQNDPLAETNLLDKLIISLFYASFVN